MDPEYDQLSGTWRSLDGGCAERNSTIATDLSTYASGACLQFITGAKSMDEWDSFIAEVHNSFNVERMTELYQEAVDAYLAIGA